MTDSSSIRRQPHMQALAAAAGYFALVLGAPVLVGWRWRIDFLKRVGEGLISMNPLTASCCICAGISLVMQLRGPLPLARARGDDRRVRRAQAGCLSVWMGLPTGWLMFRMEPPLSEPVLMMPVMDGQEMIGRLRKINPAAKIIASSGIGPNPDSPQAARDRVSHFLPKPYTAETLLKCIRQTLESDAPSACPLFSFPFASHFALVHLDDHPF